MTKYQFVHITDVNILKSLFSIWLWKSRIIRHALCVKSVLIRSYSGPHFPTFGMNTERYGVSLHIQSECDKMRTGITPNTDTFHVVVILSTKQITFIIKNSTTLSKFRQIFCEDTVFFSIQMWLFDTQMIFFYAIMINQPKIFLRTTIL